MKMTQSGIANLRFTIAVNRSFAKQGEGRQADFISCVAWRQTAENMAKFLRKGSLIGVEGRIETGSYMKDGQTVYTTDIVCDNVQFFEPRSANTQNDGYGQQNQYPQQNQWNNPPTGNQNFGTRGGTLNPEPYPQSTPWAQNPFHPGDVAPKNDYKNIPIADDDLPF
jgi:single-strand DNA-binding protein